MSVLQTILTVAGLSAHQTCFLQALLSVWLAIPGRLNCRAHPSWFRKHLRAVVENAKEMVMDTVADQGVTFVTKLSSRLALLLSLVTKAPEAARGTPPLGRQSRLGRVDPGAWGSR